MATKRTNSIEPKLALELTQPREDAKAKIEDRIEKGRELRARQVDTREAYDTLKADYSKWDLFNAELLRQIFNTDEMKKEYSFWGVAAMAMHEPSLGERISECYNNIVSKNNRLDSICDRLELIPLQRDIREADQKQTLSNTVPVSSSNKVFVVHGRDEISKTSLEVFLHEIGLEPIVLHRQADEGMTIIEKFEKHSDVGYAFVLLTPDEIAYISSEENLPESSRHKEYRARPNVIFEFGYFIGKLGRSKVCCLYTGTTTLPSDVNGLVYKRFERNIDEIGYSIIKDLKASGYNILFK